MKERPEDPHWFVSVTVSPHLFLDAEGLIRHQTKKGEVTLANRTRWRRRFLVLHLLMGERSGRVALRIGCASSADDVVLLVRRAMGGAQVPLMQASSVDDHVLTGKPRSGLVVPRTVQRHYPALIGECRKIGVAIAPNGQGGFANPTVRLVRSVEDTILELSYDLGGFDEAGLLDFSDIVGEVVTMRSERNALWQVTRSRDAP